MTDGQSGLVLCGARYYIPAIGRWLTQDPKGHDAGLNLYEYCANNPLAKWDPSGADWNFGNFVRGIKGIGNAADFLLGYVTGTGPTQNVYGPNDDSTRDLECSYVGNSIRRQIASNNWLRNARRPVTGGVGTLGAWWESMRAVGQSEFGTVMQVGGMSWQLTRSGNYINVHVSNRAGVNSFAYHLPQTVPDLVEGVTLDPDFDRAGGGFGPLGNVYQNWYWKVKVPSGR